jgi:hypothetical protein
VLALVWAKIVHEFFLHTELSIKYDTIAFIIVIMIFTASMAADEAAGQGAPRRENEQKG